MPDITRRFFMGSAAAFVAKAAMPAMPVVAKNITASFGAALPSAVQTSAFNGIEMTLAMGNHVQLFDILLGKKVPVPVGIGPDTLRSPWSESIDECTQLYRIYNRLKRYDMSPSDYYALLKNPSYHCHSALANTNAIETNDFKKLLPNMRRSFELGLSKSLAHADNYPELWASDKWTPLLDNLKAHVRKRMGLPLTESCLDGLSLEPRAHGFHEMLRGAPELMPPERLRMFRQVAREFVRHGKQLTSFEEMDMGYTIYQLPYRFGLTDLQNKWGQRNPPALHVS